MTVPIIPGNYAFGRAFEVFVVNEIYRLIRYKDLEWNVSYLRTKDDAEIDVIVDRPDRQRSLVEIKATSRIDSSDVAALARFLPDFPNCSAYCLSNDPNPQMFGPIRALPWQQGLRELGLM